MHAKSLQSYPTFCEPMDCSPPEYWSGLPFPPPRDLRNPGIEPTSLMSLALAGEFFTTNLSIIHSK